MMTTNANVAENWNFAVDFPELPTNLIERPHLLRTMVEALSVDAPILFLEGDEGDGATTTLAQFCREYPQNTFSLFIKPASSLTYGLEYLRLALAEQFHWYVYGERLEKELLSVSEYEDLRLKVARRNHASVLYFVIDGIHQIPTEDRGIISNIFKYLLPTGASKCRFIVTGLQSDLACHIHHSVKSKHYRLLKLSFDESRKFLQDTCIDECDHSKIYELCKGGSPGRLAVVRRLLLSGASLSAILDTDPAKYLEFVKLEFDVLRRLRDDELIIIAGLAFSKISQTAQDLHATFAMRTNEIENLVGKCQFLNVLTTRHIEFISETHRKYAERQLERFRRSALEAQLDYLQKNPHSEASLRFLPAYLETLNHQEAILQLLSKDHYSDLLQMTQSFSALKVQAEMGARNAQTLQRAHEVFKFSLQRSIFASASSAGGSTDRVKALVALGKSNAAMALANSEATIESRLTLLSAFARRQTERSGALDPEILEYIRRLISEVDFSSMGDQAMEIAADVLMFDPDAAIGIIESAVKGATEATKDAAYLELSVSASIAKLKHNNRMQNKVQVRISDEAFQRIANSFELIAEKLVPDELMGLIAEMPAAHQVHFLRSLVSIKRKDPRILDLVEFGLDLIIRETEYIPRTKDLAELCAPFLVPSEDLIRLKKLVLRFDSQLGLVGKAAQSRDLTVLQMRLAAAEYQYESELARHRVSNAYYEVSEIKTPEVRMECLAIMLSGLAKLDRDATLESRDGFRAVIKSDLDVLLSEVLKDTADHLSTVMPVLKALAADECEAALALSGRLNTLHRRDIAYYTVVTVLVAQSYAESRLTAVKQALRMISDEDMREQAVLASLGCIDANPEKSRWVPYLECLRGYLVHSLALSCWDCWMFKAASAAGITFDVDLLQERVKEATSRAASPLEEADVNFRAAEALSDTELGLAQKYYDNGLSLTRLSPFSNTDTAKLYELCLSLLGRSIASLARANMLDDDKLKRHAILVSDLPGITPRARVLNEFAERLWCAKRPDLVDRVVNEHIRPLLERARNIHPAIGRSAICITFPSLCASHLRLAVQQLRELSDEDADTAIAEAAMVKLRHLCGQEPEESSGRFDYSKLDVADISDVIELLAQARTDTTIFALIKTLVEAINDRNNRSRFTRTQKADWSARLRNIVDEKLPDPKNIQHPGFKVVCMAQVYSLSDGNWSQWESLEADAQVIDNCADRGYIYTELATALPGRFSETHRKRLLEKAVVEINKIPSPVDRLSHLQGYAQSAHANDAAASASECLKAAMKLAIELEDHSRVAQHRRELIDIADQINPGLADELIELVDDDPARARLKTEAKHAAAMAKAKREMANAKQVKDARCEMDLLPIAAWRNLAALEAGLLEVKSTEVMTEYVTLAAVGTLQEAYPVLAWHLTNLERKYVSANDVRTHLIPICEAMLLTTELTKAILCRVSGKGADVREDASDEGLLVRRHSRNETLNFIGNWLQNNARDEIIYCDAYFSTKDIELLRICLANAPQCGIKVIASKPHLLKEKELGEEPFQRIWRQQRSQDPPETEIIALAFADAPGKHVLHDRWLLTKDAGLRLGTSFNSLGIERLSEISEMEAAQVSVLRAQVDKYISRQREVDGARLHYSGFTL